LELAFSTVHYSRVEHISEKGKVSLEFFFFFFLNAAGDVEVVDQDSYCPAKLMK